MNWPDRAVACRKEDCHHPLPWTTAPIAFASVPTRRAASNSPSPRAAATPEGIVMKNLVRISLAVSLSMPTSTPAPRFRNTKAHLRPDGGVANPRDAKRHRCGLRLALEPNPSLSSCFATSAPAY